MGISMKFVQALYTFKKCNGLLISKATKNGTKISYLKGGNQIEKVVEKANGNKVIGYFTVGGKCTGVREITGRGTIDHSYGGQNFDKVVQVRTNDGRFYNFLGHTDRSNGILYSHVGGKYVAGSSRMQEFKTAMDYIRGKASVAQYISSHWK